MRNPFAARLPAALLLLLSSACAHSAAQTPSRTPAPAPSPAPAPAPMTMPMPAPSAAPASPSAQGTPRWTQADVKFMQGMIAHHQQALDMTALVFARTARSDLRLLSGRIALSQRDEIRLMRQWLRDRGQDTAGVQDTMSSMSHPMAHDSAMAAMPMMPGMLTPEQMQALAAASGPLFDRLFLADMIQHHQGALRMVADLFATTGAGQESEVFRLASDVDADQRAEIARMQAMLAAAPPAARP